MRRLLRALHEYGAFLVDASGGFSLVAEDMHTANPNLTDAQVQWLVAPESLSPEKTDWQLLIETINDYLSYKLLDGSGLAYAYLDKGANFRSNFCVVEDL